jgi:hypothetical protein
MKPTVVITGLNPVNLGHIPTVGPAYDRAVDVHEATSVLARTPAVFEALLAGLPPEWLHHDDGPGTWSAYDILGHVTYGDATNWVPRIRVILEYGTGQRVAPFDREAMLRTEREPVGALLSRFSAARAASLNALNDVDLTDLDREGLHPEFGAVTLRQVLATWVAHDLTHLAQAAEVLARRYRDDVGPYRAYLPALDRTAEAE